MTRLLLIVLFATAAYAHPSWYQPNRHLQDQLPKLRQLVAKHYAAAQGHLPLQFSDMVRRLDGHEESFDSGNGDEQSCALLNTPQQGQTQAFCDMSTAAIEALSQTSANDDGMETCPMYAELQAFMCHLCSDDCQNSQQFSVDDSANDESSSGDDSAMPNMAALCADKCVTGMLDVLKLFVDKEQQCVNEGKSTDLSGNDDSSSDSSDDDPLADFDIFSFGCTTNDAGENCMDKIAAWGTYAETASTDDSTTGSICDSSVGVATMETGCCFGTYMFAFTALGGEDISAEDQQGMDETIEHISSCPGGDTLLSPCTKGATKDVAVVKSALVLAMDMSTLTAAEKAATRDVLKDAISTDLGVQKKQVLITRMTSTSRRRLVSISRRLSSTTVEYQIAMDPDVTTPSSITNKISSGDVSAATIVSKAQASSSVPAAFQTLTSDDITPSTDSTTSVFVAEPNDSGGDDDDDDVELIVGVVVAVVALIIIFVVIMKCCCKKVPAAKDTPQPEAGSVPATKVVVATPPVDATV